MEQEEKERCRSEQRQWVQRFIPLCVRTEMWIEQRWWHTNLIRYTLQFTRNRPQTLFGGIQWCTSWTTIGKTLSTIHVNYPQQMTWQQETWTSCIIFVPTNSHLLVTLHTLYHAKNMSSRSAWCYGRIERINQGGMGRLLFNVHIHYRPTTFWCRTSNS